MSNMRHFVIGMAVLPLALLGLAIALASTASPPYEFNAGTTAKAAEVNANFKALTDAINDNDARLEAIGAGTVNGPVRAAAHVMFDGTVTRSFNLKGGAPIVDHYATGTYAIDFPGFTDMDTRYVVASLGGHHVAGPFQPGGLIQATVFGSNIPTRVTVKTYDAAGTPADMGFFVLIY